MRLRRPTLPRALLAAVLACGLVLAPATAALAHTGAASSDYRVEITGWVGDHRGVDLRIVDLGNRVELRRTTAATVMVLGYEGEPYLRLDTAGVAENTTSPAHFLNRDRYASTDPPPTASAAAAPTWVPISSGDVVRWHDHRAHWMSSTPRADVQADPDVERVVIDASRVELIIDGRPAAALVRVTWLPPPARWVWWGAAAAEGLAVAAALVFLPGAARLLAPVVAVGSAITLFGQGVSGTRQVLALGCIVLALGATALRRRRPARVLALFAASGATVLAATRLDVFEHELIAGWLAGPGQRVAVALGAGLCLGVLASALVGTLGPTEPAR
jgi:hypothetical protein